MNWFALSSLCRSRLYLLLASTSQKRLLRDFGRDNLCGGTDPAVRSCLDPLEPEPLDPLEPPEDAPPPELLESRVSLKSTARLVSDLYRMLNRGEVVIVPLTGLAPRQVLGVLDEAFWKTAVGGGATDVFTLPTMTPFGGQW